MFPQNIHQFITAILRTNGIIALENNIAIIRAQFPECYICLTGDLNARCKDLLE